MPSSPAVQHVLFRILCPAVTSASFISPVSVVDVANLTYPFEKTFCINCNHSAAMHGTNTTALACIALGENKVSCQAP